MKILIADDHDLFRDALKVLIERAEPEAVVVSAGGLDEALRLAGESAGWDIIILDLKMEGMNGPAGVGAMREAVPGVPVALMSGLAGSDEIRRALDYGAIGFLPKTLSGKALMNAVRLMVGGERFVPYGTMLAPAEPARSSSPELGLTEREKQVLTLLCRGQSNKLIARELGLQEVTVKLHVRGVCRKLGAANRTHAVIRAHDLGLVAPD